MDQDKTVDIGTLIPDDHNFNRGTEEGARLMQKSFEQFGAGRSVLVDKDNRIIAGNKSTKAAAESGIKRVRIIETDGTELIAVKRTDITLDSKEGRELALADNVTTQVNLAWDQTELQAMGDEYGFSTDEWGVVIPDSANPVEEPDAEEDDFDETKDPIDTICQPGDLWQLGDHRLLCGDSTDMETCKRLMGGAISRFMAHRSAVQRSRKEYPGNDHPER